MVRAIWRRVIPATAVIILAGSAVWAQTPASQPAASTRPTTVQMQQHIKELEKRIDKLQTQPTTHNEAKESAAVKKILSEADQKTAPPFDNEFGFSGYSPDRGFIINSQDGNYSLHPGILMQFRNVTSIRDNIPTGGAGIAGGTGDDTQNGFEVSRLRLTLSGNAISPLLTYYFQFDADQGAPFTLLDAYVNYRISNQSPLVLRAGQFKDPLFHERNMLPGNQLAVDRSLLDALLGGGQTERVQGGEMIYDEDRVRGIAAYHDGYNTGNTPFYDVVGPGAVTTAGAGGGANPPNWGATVRGEYLLIGDRNPQFNPFSEYDQFTALNATQNILVVGGGGDYTESGFNRVIFHTLDAQFDSTNGLSLYAAYLGAYRNLNSSKGIRKGSYYDSGGMIQASYLVTQKFEPFVRYDYTHLNGEGEATAFVKNNLHEITVGANYYFYNQNFKFTFDASWLPNGCPVDLTDLGILQDDGKNEFLIRGQLQLSL